MTVVLAGSEFGPTVGTRQSGLEHLKAVLLARVSTVALLKSGLTALLRYRELKSLLKNFANMANDGEFWAGHVNYNSTG